MAKVARITIYESPRGRAAGVTLTSASADPPATGAQWTVSGRSLAVLVPRPGDRFCDPTGTWWQVTAVAAEANGAYPLTANREGGA